MRRARAGRLAGALVAALAAPAAAAAEGLPGRPILELRLREEAVDQDGVSRNAAALTLRTRFGWETSVWNGFTALVEGEDVTALDDSYDSTTNGKARFPVVADPEGTELNRAQLAWTGAQGEAVVGRQRLILGNARFVGNVGFRQNEQTFDAVRASLKPTKDLTLTYAYVDKVRRVFGRHSPQGVWDSDSHLLQAEAKTAWGQFTAYGYLMAFDNAAAQSNATWGARFAGARPLRPNLAVTYEAEVARQSDYRNSPDDFSLGYLDLGLGLKAPAAWASVGVERLDGNGRRGFATPLATLHAFQGWADVFLATPPGGVRDLSLNAGGTVRLAPKAPSLKLQVAAHEFTDDDGSRRYGRELDLLASAALTPNLSTEVKAAVFDGARGGPADRVKLWVTLEYRY
jgi:hypothetical protein